jgi:hypothetical protein
MAPGYVVIFQEGIDSEAATADLMEQYGFEPISVFVLGFYAELSDSTLMALRCEKVVRYIEHMVPPAPPPGT